jgi:hypothetical protein
VKSGGSVGGESAGSLSQKYGVCAKVAIGKGATSVVRLAHKWDRSEGEKVYAVKVGFVFRAVSLERGIVGPFGRWHGGRRVVATPYLGFSRGGATRRSCPSVFSWALAACLLVAQGRLTILSPLCAIHLYTSPSPNFPPPLDSMLLCSLTPPTN